MKSIVYILIGILLLVGINRFIKLIDRSDAEMEMAYHMDCCTPPAECDDQNQNSGDDHTCPADCNCDCCIHIVAIEYQFLTISVATPRVYFFGSYSNGYNFHFYTPIFEPPRFS